MGWAVTQIYLQARTNQSYGDLPYEQKHPHYIKENLLVKSLCPLAYQNNPNFTRLQSELNLPFKPHEAFKKQDVDTRQHLYRAICERIWHHDLNS